VPLATNSVKGQWNNRIERAHELRQQHPAMEEALRLYAEVLRCQSEIAVRSSVAIRPEIPLRKQIDIGSACSFLPLILSATLKYGPDALRAEAKALQDAGEQGWRELMASALASEPSRLTTAHDFFLRACLQPLAESLQLQLPKDANYNRAPCPACGGMPQMAVLRPEGEGASRWLLCSFCLCEWTFRRIVCPYCGEENKEKLPRYSADEYAYIHVEACDTCKRYLKAIDLTVNGLAVPLVDEAAAAVLDVWATEHGYAKIVRNLIGF
jgi:FdhE protein